MNLKNKCIKYGNDISTDLIIAGKYTKTLNKNDLAIHAMEDIDADFTKKAQDGVFLVAGTYFGCGSSREQAPVALKEAGVVCVVAKTFSRIFYRNAVNIGLPIAECDTDRIKDGDELEYTLGGSKLINKTTGEILEISPLPKRMIDILMDGGVVEHLKKGGAF